MQKQEKKFFEGHRSTFWIKRPFGIGHPPPTHQLQSTCMGEGSRVPNLQTEFNYLDTFKSYGIFSDFVVPTWSLMSSHHPRHPPVIPTLSPSHPHVIPVVPRRSLCGLHGLWSPHVVPMSSPHRPRCPCHPQKVPMWSPWSVVSTCCLHCPHIVPVIPMSSPSSPHHQEGPYIIPNPPDTHSTHPPPPWGGGGPESVNMQ